MICVSSKRWSCFVLLLGFLDCAACSNVSACTTNPGHCIKCAGAGHAGGNCQIIKTIDGGDVEACCAACSTYPGCDFWVFNTQYNACYLKSGDSSDVVTGSCTSGHQEPAPPAPPPAPPPKPCTGTRLLRKAIKCQGPDHPGGDCIPVQTLPFTTAEQCCQWCAGKPSCDFWVLSRADQACYLKRGDSSYVIDDPDHDSGIMNNAPSPGQCSAAILPNICIPCLGFDPKGGACTIIATQTGVSQEQCCENCANRKECAFWVYNSATKTCKLKWGDKSGVHLQCDAGVTGVQRQVGCSGGWPRFASKQALTLSPWAKYFTSVYGELPTSGFPMCMGDFWMFYDSKVSAAGVHDAPDVISTCPTADVMNGQHYQMNNILSAPQTSWSWHPPPFSALASSTWIEVIHKKDPWGDENPGVWMFYAKGSGIWFNTGKTKSFGDHDEAYKFFGVNKGNYNEEMSKTAAAQGFDSLQFTAHIDAVEYKYCDAHHNPNIPFKAGFMNIEIVGMNLNGEFSCASKDGKSPLFRSGWDASKPCVCDTSQDFLNCAKSLRYEVEGLVV